MVINVLLHEQKQKISSNKKTAYFDPNLIFRKFATDPLGSEAKFSNWNQQMPPIRHIFARIHHKYLDLKTLEGPKKS